MTSKEIRRQFLDFFAARGHAIVESSPVVPLDDPTLMFTNAGMNQFKDVFLGTGSRSYRRAADTQKCIRAGGKHNDLDDVGQDTYHHTFFEMLGNWSFGDYFKKEAIAWAWELLTKVWRIDKGRLYATYFRGDPAEGLEPDTEAAELWRKITDIDPSHIHPGSKKDNFWEMGDTGPCGPCSEIHIDLTPDKSGGRLVNSGDARVMELWNLVFIQYNRGAGGKLTPLPAMHVDTGMGFERLCAVLQAMPAGRLGSFSNYDTDVFTPIFDAIRKRTGAPEYTGLLPGEPRASARAESPGSESSPPDVSPRGLKSAARDQLMIDVSYRVIADHLRCLAFAITDGAMPSNEGRGYVLRRILRRAVRYGRQYLNMHEPFLCDLVEPLVAHMGDAFSELCKAHGGKNVRHVTDILRDEEASFLKTLDRGIRLFDEAADYAETHHHGRIGGDAAFKLHDTYGFPIDLTEQMAEERGLTVDIVEYELLMACARRLARATDVVVDGEAEILNRNAIQKAREEDPPEDKYKYDAELRRTSRITGGAWNVGLGDNAAQAGQKVVLNLEQTPFYAEQGGQVSDVGEIVTSNGTVKVTHVARHDHPAGFAILHIGTVVRGKIVGGGEQCEAIVSREHRIPTMKNHTATHILNWALRDVLGEHVQQKGSLVDPDKTRFDFSHPKPLGSDEISRIEALIKAQIASAYEVYDTLDGKREVDQKQARQINTLRAVFGEKYPEVVRVVSIGAPIDQMLRDPKNPKWMQYSVEFCGGTHLKNSKEAEEFVLVAEEAVAKGIRRVVGLTADAARQAIRRGEQLLEVAEALRKGSHRDPSWDVKRLLQEVAEATIPVRARLQLADQIAVLQEAAKQQDKKAVAKAQRGAVEAVADLLAGHAVVVAGVTVLVGEVPAGTADALRSGIDYIRNKKGSSAALLATIDDGRVTFVAGMSRDVVDRGIKAGDLIKEICPLVGGKGGGRPDMAQGGGTDTAGLPAALSRAKEWICQKLS